MAPGQLVPNTTRNVSRRTTDRRTNQRLGSVLDGASCVQREPPPRPPEERAEPAVASCSRPPKNALGKKHRRCLQPAGGLPPAGQRDGGGGHAADRRRPVRDGARATRRLLRGNLRDLRRPRLRPARQRERRLLQVQHRRGAASPPHARARGTGDTHRSGVDGAASNRATSRACSRRRGRRSSTTTSTTGFSRRRTRRRRRRCQTITSLSCRHSTPARAGSRRNSRRGNA